MTGLRRWPFYPAAVSAYLIANAVLESGTPLEALPRPLIAAVVIVLALQATLMLAAGRHRGAFIGLLVLLVLINETLAALAVGLAIGLFAMAWVRARRAVPVPWPTLTPFLNLVAALALVVMLVNGVLIGALTFPESSLQATSPGTPREGAPDIYVVVLDGYPRADTLLRDFGFDSSGWHESLRELGFEVADQAHANYNATALTLASMLNARHIQELIPDPPADQVSQTRLLSRLISDPAAVGRLKGNGYEIVHIPSGFFELSLLHADRVLDSGQPSAFETSLFRWGRLKQILPGWQSAWLLDQHRDRIHATFDRLVELSGEASPRPRFVLAHVMAPHPPIAFGADGSPRDGAGCFPTSCGFWDQLFEPGDEEAVRGQVAYMNALVLAAADEMLRRSPRPPVVVFLSDHGFRHSEQDPAEMLRNLIVSYTPGKPGLFPEDASPINVIPRLANAYLDLGLPSAAEDSWYVDFEQLSKTGYFPLLPLRP